MTTEQFTPPTQVVDGATAAAPGGQFAPPVATPAAVPAQVVAGGGLPAQSAPKTSAVSFRPSDFVKTGFLDDIAVTILTARWVNDFEYKDAQGKVRTRVNPSTNMNEPIPPQLALKVTYRLDDGTDSEQFYTAGNRDRFDLLNEGKGLMGDDRNKGIPDSTNVSFFLDAFVKAGLVETFLDGNDIGRLDGHRVHLHQLPTPNRNFREVGPSAAGASGPTQGQGQTQRTLPVPTHIYSAPGEVANTTPVAVPASVAPPVAAPIAAPVTPATTPAPITSPAPVAAPPIQPPTSNPAPVVSPELVATLTTELTEFVSTQKGNGVGQVPKGGFVTTLISKFGSDQALAGNLVQAADDSFFNSMVASGVISGYDQVTLTF